MMDDYLANRLSDADRTSFEQMLEADPTLKSEFTSQQSFIDGIKKARVAELKNIMNNTPIPPAVGGSAVTLKIAAYVIAMGLVGFGVYWFSMDENQPSTEVVAEEIIPAIESHANEVEVIEDQQTPEVESAVTEAEEIPTKEVKKKINAPKATPAVRQPKLEVYDPSKEVKADHTTEAIVPIIPGEKQKVSLLIVETDNTQKKFNFHYQFQDGKLILMGSFDATLYEILEFFADDKRTIFLYYASAYYLLDESKTKPTPLNQITDKQLLQKLELYRSN